MTVTILTGDCRDILTTLPDQSVQCCVTSPPYFGLRDYGVDGQIGLERTVDAYVAEMVSVFREVRRVLRDDGTLWLNLGDSYASAWPAPNTRRNIISNPMSGGKRGPQRESKLSGDLKEKDLIGVPWRVSFALQADGWYLRSDIIWHKPNPMPESVRDRPTKSHEYLFLLTKQPRYFFDAEAVKEQAVSGLDLGLLRGRSFADEQRVAWHAKSIQDRQDAGVDSRTAGDGSRNIRSVWTIPTAPFSEAHFATFPPALVEPCIKAGTSEKGQCPACGSPWVRVVEREKHPTRDMEAQRAIAATSPGRSDGKVPGPEGMLDLTWTTGWQPSCACNAGDPVPQTVLDPFSGSGTVGLVASRIGRSYIGVELNPEYVEMSRRRIEQDAPMLNVVDVVRSACDTTDRGQSDSLDRSLPQQMSILGTV